MCSVTLRHFVQGTSFQTLGRQARLRTHQLVPGHRHKCLAPAQRGAKTCAAAPHGEGSLCPLLVVASLLPVAMPFAPSSVISFPSTARRTCRGVLKVLVERVALVAQHHHPVQLAVARVPNPFCCSFHPTAFSSTQEGRQDPHHLEGLMPLWLKEIVQTSVTMKQYDHIFSSKGQRTINK